MARLVLCPWTAGRHGKFLVTADARLHHWRTDLAGVPHHAQAARALGVDSAIDGVIEPGGAAWVSASSADVDRWALLREIRAEMEAGGMRLEGAPVDDAWLAAFGRLWRGRSDLRFGQVLRLALHEPVLLEHPSPVAEPRGPFWDTESETGRTFLNGLPRDPARIPLVLAALRAAWDANGGGPVHATLAAALDHAGIPENEFGTRLLLVEDAALRRALEDFTRDVRLRGEV